MGLGPLTVHWVVKLSLVKPTAVSAVSREALHPSRSGIRESESSGHLKASAMPLLLRRRPAASVSSRGGARHRLMKKTKVKAQISGPDRRRVAGRPPTAAVSSRRAAQSLCQRTASGPATQDEVDRLVSTWVQEMPAADREHVCSWFQAGVEVLTDFSGSGQGERAVLHLRDVFAPFSEKPLKAACLRSSDVAPHCRQVLGRTTDDTCCILGDIADRLPSDLRDSLRMICNRYRAEFDQALSAVGQRRSRDLATEFGDRFVREAAAEMHAHAHASTHLSESHCFRHDVRCNAFPDDGARSRGGLRINISGIPCIDWSSRGHERGVCGGGAMGFLSLMWGFQLGHFDIGVLECTRKFRHEHLEIMLQPFVVESLVFSPSQLGVPAERYRKYMLVLNTRTVKWASGAGFDRNLFLARFGCALSASGSLLLEGTPKAVVREEIQEMAKDLAMPPHDGDGRRWPMRMVLSRGMRRQLQKHVAALDARGEAGDADKFTMLDQNPSHTQITSCVPALLQRSSVWSYRFGRLMLPAEHLAVMGIPSDVIPERWPKNLVKSLAGNAMHFSALSAVVLHALVGVRLAATHEGEMTT